MFWSIFDDIALIATERGLTCVQTLHVYSSKCWVDLIRRVENAR